MLLKEIPRGSLIACQVNGESRFITKLTDDCLCSVYGSGVVQTLLMCLNEEVVECLDYYYFKTTK